MCALLALPLMFACPPAAVGQDRLSITVTAFGIGTTAKLGPSLRTIRGDTSEDVTSDPIQFEMTSAAGVLPQAILLLKDEAQMPVAALVLHDVVLELRALTGARFVASMSGMAGGSLDVHLYGTESDFAIVSVEGATIVLARGSVRVERVADGVQISVGDGRATVYSGGLPAGGVAALTGGVVLEAGGDNTVMVMADAALSLAARVEQVADAMRSRRSAIVQRSLLPDLVLVAEQVTEGDIEPPMRGAQVPVAAVAPQVRIPQIVPRGSLASQVISGSQGFATSTVQATAESFIGSNDAALAVVGVRLQRTRITASFVAGAGAPLSVNRELLRPFTIGPLRR